MPHKCKEARKEYQRKYYERNKEIAKRRARKHYEENREAKKEYQREYYEANREAQRESHRNYYEKNCEALKAYQRGYYEENREVALEYGRKYHEENREKRMFLAAKWRAAKKGLPFNLSQEDIVIPEVCPVLGVVLEVGSDSNKEFSPSLDRIIPELGYVKGNVRVISGRANRLKSDASVEELEAILKYTKGQEIL